MEAAPIPSPRGELQPVRARGAWIAWGVVLQVIAAGIPVAIALHLASRDGVLGSITRYTVRLVWQQMSHSAADLALVVLGVAMFIAGSVVLARPFVRRRSTLLVGVPLAALVGLLALGVFAVVVAIVIAVEQDPSDAADIVGGNLPMPDFGRRERR